MLSLPTPLVRAASLCSPGRQVYLKDETVLPTGSFKVRGALHALTAALDRQPVREVVAASTGNHGAAVAWAAARLGVSARIFVPAGANPIKTRRIVSLGAELVEAGRDLSAAIDAAEQWVAATGAFFLHDASSPDVPIGTAGIGAEILEQLPGVDAVYVPMGDTALIRGVGQALRGAARRIRLTGVVAAAAPSYERSWRARHVVETASADTIADGLAVRRPLAPNVTAICALVDDVVLVEEGDMLAAVRWLADHEGLVAEPSGAASVAALQRDTTRRGELVALVTGCNISPTLR